MTEEMNELLITKTIKMKKQRFYTWNLDDNCQNNILIYEQTQENENSYNCVSHIILQLLQENTKYKFNLKIF